jgi:uncharacterized protein (DUF433 family)
MPSDPAPRTSAIQKTPGGCGGQAGVRNTRHTVPGLVQGRALDLIDGRILEHHLDLIEADLEAAGLDDREHPEDIDQALRDDAES